VTSRRAPAPRCVIIVQFALRQPVRAVGVSLSGSCGGGIGGSSSCRASVRERSRRSHAPGIREFAVTQRNVRAPGASMPSSSYCARCCTLLLARRTRASEMAAERPARHLAATSGWKYTNMLADAVHSAGRSSTITLAVTLTSGTLAAAHTARSSPAAPCEHAHTRRTAPRSASGWAWPSDRRSVPPRSASASHRAGTTITPRRRAPPP
jgi:hypothetical protein